VPIGDARLSLNYRVASRTVTSVNVIGMVKGRPRPDEAFVYSAHWDGLGRATSPGQSRRVIADQGGDDIYNGAVDNAVGVGTIIEIARRFGRAEPPERSVYFIAFTWEEAVHLGALAYVNAPSVPLEQTVGLLNFDVTSLFGRTRDITILGGGRNDLERRVTEIARRYGKSVRLPRDDAEGYYRRSDHYQFARRGVPVVFLFGGATPLEQNARTAALVAHDARYIAERYHTVDDEWTPLLDFAGVAEVADIAFEVGSYFANGREWPTWYDGAAFRAVRDRSEAARQ
jgi:Zn-dependent M28 family amino/carboxypeptidase